MLYFYPTGGHDVVKQQSCRSVADSADPAWCARHGNYIPRGRLLAAAETAHTTQPDKIEI